MAIDEIRKGNHRFIQGISRIILGILLAVILTTETVELWERTFLVFHMLPEHIAYILVGVLTATGTEKIMVGSLVKFRSKKSGVFLRTVYSTFSRINITINRKGILGTALVSILIVYWHIPENFTLAVLSSSIHLQMHFSFVLIGVILLTLTKVLSKIRLLVLIIVTAKVMTLFGFYLSIIASPIYATYDLEQHGLVGLIMSASMIPIIALSVIYIVRRIMR